MGQLSGFDYFPVQFTKDAALHDPAEPQALKAHLDAGGVTDLLVISHGWNNDMQEARDLYAAFLANLKALLAENRVPAAAGRRFAVLGVLWPSKKFADQELIPSGAAGASMFELAALREKIDSLRGAFDAPDSDQRLDELKALLPKLEDSGSARDAFVEKLRALVPQAAADPEDASNEFFTRPADEVFDAMAKPVSFTQPAPAADTGGAMGIGMGVGAGPGAGGAAGLGEFFSGIGSAARNLLNYTTYYQMKARAGLVGSRGVNPLLREIAAAHPQLRIHLVGHSFGGRLVAATAAGESDAALLKVRSLSLLQAAFSHYGFARNWDGKNNDGFFRRVVRGGAVAGPTVITCTPNDKAVGVAYPLATLVGGRDQLAAGLGDKDSKYGGIGRNGAQKTPEAKDLAMLDVGGAYALAPGKLHNLSADAFVKDHGDVANRQVVYAVLSAMAAA
jgi:pimeloyl-ACP methyl ester carboxylesterase